ncbi:MAG: putative chaperone protein, partial [Maribacter sp.]
MNPYIYGIDFGTTNSALSIIDTRSNEIVQTFNEGSLIYFPKPERRQAISHFVGMAAKEKYVESHMNGRFMKSIKRILPRSGFQETRVHGKRYKAENLVAVVLLHLKRKADDFLGMEIKKAVLGRPVIFDENKEKDQLAQDRLLKAAKLSGFEEIHFQMEPIAAAFTYERKIEKEETVLVADLGGGTSDFTLMKLSPQKLNKINRK